MDSASNSRFAGAILLIAGSCIGAGMLAMPAVTGMAGFLPAVVIFVLGWAFMTTTGLLLLEINLWLGEEVSIVSMCQRTLGRFGQVASWILFCLLFYLILVAYSAASGMLIADFAYQAFGVTLPSWVGSAACTAIFGGLVFAGTRPVDMINRLFMVGLVVTYLALVVTGSQYVDNQLLSRVGWEYAPIALPLVVISFGFHNMIPSLTRYLHRDATRLRLAVLIGSLIPLVVYLVWEWVILGIVPHIGPDGLATHALHNRVGSAWVAVVADYFSFFAIVTSFLAQALSLVHFLADGMHKQLTAKWRGLLTLLTVVPPFCAALIDPTIFTRALGFAGAYSAVILFGIFPALMVWVKRYRENQTDNQIIGGGRLVLTLVALIAVGVIVMESLRLAGVVAV